MWRNALGAILAVLAAAGAVVSPFLDWYGSREGWHYKLTDLFSGDGITADDANLFTGIFLAMLIAAALLLVGAVLRTGWPMALGAVIALGITILWMVRQYQVADSLAISRDGMGEGVACALIAGVLSLLAATATYGRGHGRHRRGERGGREREREREGELVEGPWPPAEHPDERRDAA